MVAATTLLDASQLRVLLGGYGVGTARCLADPFLALKAQGYRRNLSARMQALDRAAATERLPACDSIVSRKVDGECTLLLIDHGQCCTVNPGGVVRHGLPFMEEAARLLSKSKHKQALLAGELHLKKAGRERVHDVSRAARQPDSEADLSNLHFALFDILELDGKPGPSSTAAVFKQLDSLFGAGERIRPVDSVKAKSTDDVLKAYEKWVEKEGSEGLVVRSDTAGWFKLKPRLTVDAAVLGFTEGTEHRAGMVHDLLLGLMRKDETFHVLGRVGGGFTDDQRREWLSDLKDMATDSDYAEVNDAVAYQMVRPEWVVEVSMLDLINQNTRGGSVERMVLEYSGDRYKSIRRLPLASPISPVFIRRREDKSVRPDDLRIQQVADVIEVPMMDVGAREVTAPRSEVLRREVFTKTLKGALMVRKLLLWATNKAGEGSSYPAFVAAFTDFSPNRATPLEREVRISNSRDQIEALYQSLKEENIVKGWAPA
jgi:hypothetical protein